MPAGKAKIPMPSSDTTVAIYGQIAGAAYGAEAIPAEWRDVLTMGSEITSMADSLYDHARPSLPAALHQGHSS